MSKNDEYDVYEVLQPEKLATLRLQPLRKRKRRSRFQYSWEDVQATPNFGVETLVGGVATNPGMRTIRGIYNWMPERTPTEPTVPGRRRCDPEKTQPGRW